MSLLVWSHVPSRRSMMSLPVWSHFRTSFRRGVCGLRRGSLLPGGHYNGWYASYRNAVLFLYNDCRAISNEEIVLLPHFYFNLRVLGKRVQGHVGIPRMTVGPHVPIELVLGSLILYLYALSCLLMHFTPTHTHYCHLCLLVAFSPPCIHYGHSCPYLVISSLYILCQYLDQPAHFPKHFDQFLTVLLPTFTTGLVFVRLKQGVATLCFD